MQGVGGLCSLCSFGDCINSLSQEASQTRGVKQQNVLCLSCGAWKSKVKDRQGAFPLRPLFLACRWLSFPCACREPLSVRVCDLISPLQGPESCWVRAHLILAWWPLQRPCFQIGVMNSTCEFWGGTIQPITPNIYFHLINVWLTIILVKLD